MRIILDCVIQVHYGLHNPELSQHFFLELPIQKRCNIILGSSNLEHKKKRATIMEWLVKATKKNQKNQPAPSHQRIGMVTIIVQKQRRNNRKILVLCAVPIVSVISSHLFDLNAQPGGRRKSFRCELMDSNVSLYLFWWGDITFLFYLVIHQNVFSLYFIWSGKLSRGLMVDLLTKMMYFFS